MFIIIPIIAFVIALLLVFQTLWHYLSIYFLCFLLVLIIGIMIVKKKRGSSLKEILKKTDTSQAKQQLLTTMLQKIEEGKIVTSKHLQSDICLLAKTGIYLFSINQANNTIKGNIEDKQLVDFVDTRNSYIKNSFQILSKDEQYLLSILKEAIIYKIVVINNATQCEVEYTKEFKIYRFKDVFYEIQRSIKEENRYTEEEIKQFYLKIQK